MGLANTFEKSNFGSFTKSNFLARNFESDEELWIAIGSNKITLGGLENGGIMVSKDAINWTVVSGLLGTANTFGTDIIFGNVVWNGKIWVAIGISSDITDQNGIATSITGKSWTVRPDIFIAGCNVVWNGSLFRATGSFFNILNPSSFFGYSESLDGITWTPYTADTTAETKGLSWDNTHWNTRPYSSGNIDTGVLWNGTQWIKTTAYGIWTSPDGLTWSGNISDPYTQTYNIGYDGTQYIRVRGTNFDTIQRSTNLTTWSTVTNCFEYRGYSVSWNGKLWVAGGWDSVASRGIATSEDGINWTLRNCPFKRVFAVRHNRSVKTDGVGRWWN